MSDQKPARTPAETAVIDLLLSEEGFPILERGMQSVVMQSSSPLAQKAMRLVTDIKYERMGENTAMDQLAAVLRHSDPDM
jgi:hypothetical protein